MAKAIPTLSRLSGATCDSTIGMIGSCLRRTAISSRRLWSRALLRAPMRPMVEAFVLPLGEVLPGEPNSNRRPNDHPSHRQTIRGEEVVEMPPPHLATRSTAA